MKTNIKIKTFSLLLFLMMVMPMFAQGPSEAPDDTDDDEAPLDPVPINDYIIPMLIIGVCTGYVLLKKKDRATQ